MEFEAFRLLVELGIVVLKCLNDVGTETLTIFLRVEQEGAANKVRGVERRELGQLGPSLLVGGESGSWTPGSNGMWVTGL